MADKEAVWESVENKTTPIIEEVVRLLSSVSILRLHIRSVLEIVTEDDYYEPGYQKKLTKRIKEAVKELKKQQEQFSDDKSFQAEIGARIEQLTSVQSTLDNQYDQIRLIIPELMAASSLLENSGILKKKRKVREVANPQIH